MSCVSTVCFNVKVEGSTIKTINPKCGLRQGDPLSPYLFILVADVLSKMVIEHVARGDLQGTRLAKSCPILSHCFFADDSMFFLGATKKNCDTFKSILEEYCMASGQRVNLDKSCLFVSPKVSKETKEMIGQTLGNPLDSSPGKYLGLPILWGRSKNEALAFVRDKIVTICY